LYSVGSFLEVIWLGAWPIGENLIASAFGELLEVLGEGGGEVLGRFVVGFSVGPAVFGDECDGMGSVSLGGLP